jgi:hypothetical protein
MKDNTLKISEAGKKLSSYWGICSKITMLPQMAEIFAGRFPQIALIFAEPANQEKYLSAVFA